MELMHDWKALNRVLFPKEFSAQALTGSSLYMLLDNHQEIKDGLVSTGAPFMDRGMILEGFSKENGQKNNQGKLDAMASKYSVDHAAAIYQDKLDIWLSESATLGTNYFEQLTYVREKIINQIKDMPVSSRKNFVLEFFKSRAAKALPSRFNALVFIDERKEYSVLGSPLYSAILLTYVKGKLDSFYEPDFSSLHENRLVDWKGSSDAIGQYLETRYMLPCYAILMSREEWQKCLEYSVQTKTYMGGWQRFIKFYDNAKAQFYPKTAFLKLLVATQRVVMYVRKPNEARTSAPKL